MEAGGEKGKREREREREKVYGGIKVHDENNEMTL